MTDELLSQSELYGQWRDRWSDFLTDIEGAVDEDEIERKLRDKVTIGNAERRIAGGHEGREVLELLQNARDAIQKGTGDRGRVYIGVYDEGVMVANTGSRFDFFHPKVEKAVTMIGETGKGGDDDGQSIGHKGVGLKSILATGDSFEIYTRPDSATDDVLGVKLSRTYLLGSLLSRLGVDVPLNDLVENIRDPDLQGILSEHTDSSSVTLDADIREALSKLPLFNFPVPLDVGKANDEVAQRAKQLLREKGESEQFRTAVFVRYEDEQWRELLEQSDIDLPEEGGRSLTDRPDRIWEYLAHSENSEGLRKETLVQLGGIQSLQLERHSGSELIAREHWSVGRSGNTDPLNPALHHETVEVGIEGMGESHREVFDQFQFEEDTEHDVSLLVEKEATKGTSEYPREYPLYLYYPIQNTSTTSLPFCLHGRFRVETNRKDLSNHNIEENKSVLNEGLDLVEAVSAETAQKLASDGPYGTAYPWLFLPPTVQDAPDEPTTQSELLRWFSKKLYDRLRNSKSIALDAREKPASPASTLLHWNDRTLAGYRSLERVGIPETTEDQSIRPLPAKHVLEAYEEFPTRWVDRLRQLLLADADATEYTDDVVRDLAVTLSNRLAGFDSSTIRVDEKDGRNLLYGFVDLVLNCTEGDEEVEKLLDDLSESLEGVYLLPCTIPGEEQEEDTLQLVPIERRRSPKGERTPGVQSRSIIWDIKSDSRTTKTPEPPHPKTSFTVYFFDGRAEQDQSVHKILSLSGKLWGIRNYDGIPSFVRSLLDAFAFGSKNVLKPVDFAFLADAAKDLKEDSSDLQSGEGQYLPLSYLNSAIQSEGDQRRNLERRIQLRNCSVRLPKQESPYPVRTTTLGDAWQEYLLNDDADSDEEEANLDQLTYTSDTWPDPSATSWEPISNFRSVEMNDIADTLSLLGASVFPNTRVVWMYGESHPDMSQPTIWNPENWPDEEFGGVAPSNIQDLIDVLDEFDGEYQRWITAPGFHPQDTAGHSSKCNVKTDGVLHKTNIASWVWCDDIEKLEQQGVNVIFLLQRFDDQLLNSVLQTGWTCSNGGHNRRDWIDTVPTLFNWQLRKLSAWSTVLEIDDDISEQWPESGRTVEFAVQAGSSQGAQAERLFPTIDSDSDNTPSEAVLNSLGVKSIDSLNSTQAARRLQKLQEVLAVDTLGEGQTRLQIPSGRENDWNQAYTKLLKPLMQRLPDENPEDSDFADGGFLTHFPLINGDSWVSVPVEWLRETAEEQVRRYKDQSPKPWEKHEVSESDYYVLRHTSDGPFVRMANHFGVKQVAASKPVIPWSEAEQQLVEDDGLSGHLRSMRKSLLERRDLLVASTEREQESEIRETADNLRSAVENLAVFESFPDTIEAQLSDRASGLYQTADGQTGLAFNQSSCESPPQLSSLAMALALLVERPTNIATFREALQESVEITELETRWERLTFPVDTVRRVLGSELTKQLEQRFTAVESLLNQHGDSIDLPTDEALSELADADSAITEAAKRWFASGGQSPDILEEYDAVLKLGTKVRDALPSEYHFVLRNLFHPGETTEWQTTLPEQTLSDSQEDEFILWLLDNSSTLPSPPVDPVVRTGWKRLLTLVEVWNSTEVNDLSEIEVWHERTDDFEGSISLNWTDSTPPIVTSDGKRPILFYLATEEEFHRASSTFFENVVKSLPGEAKATSTALERYIKEGELPVDSTSKTSSRQHQEQAFSEIQNRLVDTEGHTSTLSELTGETELANTPPSSLSVSAGSDSGAGGSRQYTGRGQQAEVYTIVSVLDRLSEWLEHSPRGVMRNFKSQLRGLHKEQQSTNYKWHVENAWQSGLLDILQDPTLLDEDSLRDWREDMEDRKLSNLPIVRLLNITQEQGPGFDIIDPFGSLNTDLRRERESIRFAPVEVKAVGGTEPPFHFRLTTNEYRRCKAFLRVSDSPYIIRLVYVPEPDTPDWPAHTEFVGERVIDSRDELNQLIEVERFEEVVKGGYMNMKLG